jgi:hypothetical protein
VFIIDAISILIYTGVMQSREKIRSLDPDELRFPTSKRFPVVCQKSTANKGQFNFAFVAGQTYEAYELIEGKDYIVWFSPQQYEAITGSTFKNYFSVFGSHTLERLN